MSIKITEQNFDTEVLQSAMPVVVDFWADWCGARKIDAIPALLLFRNGQEVSRSVGYKPAAELEAWLRENGAI